MTNAEVFKHWRVLPSARELQVRRLRYYQALARNPLHHTQVLASMFGQTSIEKSLDIMRLGVDGQIVDGSTPAARQAQADIDELAALDDYRHFNEAPGIYAFFQTRPGGKNLHMRGLRL